MERNSPTAVRFGVFEMDLAARELRKSGVRVRLQDQPFRVLALLVERPGEIVTREEIKDAVWASDTFVEFDHGLNTVVQKIRQALGDSATSPRFLETVPRRGYRFIAPVDFTRAGEVQPQEAPEQRRRFLWTAVAGLAAVAASAGWWLTRPTEPRFEPGDFQLRRLTYDGGLAYQPAISADGKLVVYASDRAGQGNLDIWLQQTAGGDPIQLTSDSSDDFEPSFSPDAAQVVFRSTRGDGGIYVVASLGGEPRWLAPNGRRPRFSPDGRQIAYWIGKEHVPGGSGSRVLLVASEGGEPTEVDFGRSPVWSPAGDRLLYMRARRGGPSHREWVTSKLDGGEPPAVTGALEFLRKSELAGDPKIIGGNAFVPEGWLNDGRVLFSAGGRQAFNIWSIHLSPRSGRASAPPERITTGSGEHRFASAANDLRLVFSDLRANSDIGILPAETNRGEATGEIHKAISSAAIDDHPSLSADGTILAFRSNRSGMIDVWMKNLTTDETKSLTATEKSESPIIANANGELVAYGISEQPEAGLSRDAYTVNTADGRIQKLCEGCGYFTDWSPSGNLLVGYAVSAAAQEVGINRTVTLTDLSTGQSRVLFENQPDWRFSPDERWLAFHNSSLGAVGIRQVFVAPLPQDGQIEESQLIPITDGSDNSFRAAWSPDGALLYYASERDGYRCIYAQPLDPDTKQPSGSVREVYHSHDPRISLGAVGDPGSIGLSVARDKIAFTMVEMTSDIWIMEPRDAE